MIAAFLFAAAMASSDPADPAACSKWLTQSNRAAARQCQWLRERQQEDYERRLRRLEEQQQDDQW